MTEDQKPNEHALELINELGAKCEMVADLLQGDVLVEPETPDDPDEYEPQMHNLLPEGGKRYPGLDRRMVAIGITQLQIGLMALRKAAGQDGGQF